MLQKVLLLMICLTLPGQSSWAGRTVPDNQNSWLDRSHRNLALHTRQAAIWFDNFFADDYSDEEPASVRTQITIGGKTSRHGADDLYAKIRIKAKLPNLKDRFYLVLSNEDEKEQDFLTLESKRPDEIEEATDNNFNAALRWIKRSTLKEQIDAKIGFRSGPNVYLLGRHRRYHNLTKSVKLHLTPAVFIDSEYGAGIRLLTEFDYLFDHPGLIRFSVRGQFDNRSEGIEWRSGLSYTYRLSNKGAIVGGVYMRGESDGEEIENYSASIRLRKRFWRPYLFYEIEPFIDWPAEDNYRTNSGVAISLQVIIGE